MRKILPIMIVMLLAITVLIIVVAIGLLFAGLIAISPVLLCILALPIIDFLAIKAIFSGKSKKEKE